MDESLSPEVSFGQNLTPLSNSHFGIDAAHVHSPTGGQGLNSSVQDSVNLCWKLSVILKNDLQVPSLLLGSYTAERSPVIAEMLSQTAALLKKTSEAKKGNFSAWKRDDVLRQMGVNYRGSPIVTDERTLGNSGGKPYSNTDGKVCAGDRAPDAPGLVDVSGRTTKLFDRFNTYSHTVLIFGPPALNIVEALAQYPRGAIQCLFILPKGSMLPTANSSTAIAVEDRGEHAHIGYAVANKKLPTIVVVRPDGAIGAIAFRINGLQRYFNRIFIV